MPAPTPTAPTLAELKTNRDKAVADAQARTFEKDGEVAVQKLRDSLGRYEAAKADNLSDELLQIERKQNLFLKRWALLLAVGGLRFKNGNEEWEDAVNLKMPVAQIMGCGARVSIVGVGDDRVLNWLLSDKEVVGKDDLEGGTKENESIARSEADKNSKLAHIRDAASHSFGRGKEKDKEDKLRYNIFRALSLFRGVTGNMHLGVDLAIGAYGSDDIHGRKITRDGLSGHAYLGVNTGSHNLLLGMEGCTSPKSMLRTAQGQFQIHNIKGEGGSIGAFGTMSLTKQPDKKDYPTQLPTEKEGKYDFFKIDFSSKEAKERLETVLKLNPNDFSDDIAGCVPVSIRKKTKVDEKLLASYRGNINGKMLSPKAFDAFDEFCKKVEFNPEGTDFLIKYEKYERMRLSGNPKKEDLLKKFNEIYNTFIKKDTQFQVNISATERERMSEIFDDINDTKPSIDILQKDVFFEPVNVVRRLLGSDTYNRFIKANPNSKPPEPGSPIKNMVAYYHNDKKVLANFNPTGTKTPNTVYYFEDTSKKYDDLTSNNKIPSNPSADRIANPSGVYNKVSDSKQLPDNDTLNFDNDRLMNGYLAVKNGQLYKIQKAKAKFLRSGEIKAVPIDRDVSKKGWFNSRVKSVDSHYKDLNELRSKGYEIYTTSYIRSADKDLAYSSVGTKKTFAIKINKIKRECNKLEEIVKSDLKDKASQDNPLPTGFYVEIPKKTEAEEALKKAEEAFKKATQKDVEEAKQGLQKAQEVLQEASDAQKGLDQFLSEGFDRTKREIPGFLVTNKQGQSFKIIRSKKGGFKVTPVEKDVSGQSRWNSFAKKVGDKTTCTSLADLESKEYTIYKLSTDPVASNILKHLASKSLEAEGTDLGQFKKDHSSALAPRDDWQTVTVDLAKLQEAVQTKPSEHNEYYDAAYLMTNILMPKFKEFKDALDKGADKTDLEKFDSDLLGILVNWAHRFSQKNDRYGILNKYQEMWKVRNDPLKTAAEENAFIGHCVKAGAANGKWDRNQAEVLVAVALQKLREAGSSIDDIKTALAEAYQQYDKANKTDVAADLVRSGTVAFISGESVVTEKSLEGKTKEDKAAEFLNKILGKDKLFGEQKEFIEQMWGQGRFGSGISVPITNSIKDNIKSSSAFLNSMTENSDEIPFSCFIKREDVERVKLDVNGVAEIDPSTKKKIMEKIKKTYVVASKKMSGNTGAQQDERGICTTIVDITNLKGEHFTAGCASGEVPVRVVIEAPRENMERFGINPNDRDSRAGAKDQTFTKGMADEDKKLFDGAKKDMKMVELAKYAANPSEYEKTLKSSKTSSAAPSGSPSKPSAAKALPYLEKVESFRKAIKSTNTDRKPESGYNGMGIEIKKCDTGFQITKIYSPESTKRIVHDTAGDSFALQEGQIITAIKVERNGKVGYYQPTEPEIIAVLRGTGEAKFKIDNTKYKKVGSVSMVSNPDAADRGNKEYVDLAELFKTNLGLAQKAIEAIESPKTRSRSSAVIGRG